MAISKMKLSPETIEYFIFGSDVQFTGAKPMYVEPDPNAAIYPGARIPRVKITDIQKNVRDDGNFDLEITVEGDDEILANHPTVSVRISKSEETYKDGKSYPFYFKDRHTLRDSITGEILAGYKNEYDLKIEKISKYSLEHLATLSQDQLNKLGEEGLVSFEELGKLKDGVI